jgi:hypothetical protein
MKQTLSLKHIVKFKPTSSFSERESLINNEVSNILETLRNRGFYPLGFEIKNKNGNSATVVVEYNI